MNAVLRGLILQNTGWMIDMTLKLRSLTNKLIEDNGKEVRFLLSKYMIRRILKISGNYFILALRDKNYGVVKRLGYFEILRVTRKIKRLSGSGGVHKECVLKRWTE
jgi:hypothetical protein